MVAKLVAFAVAAYALSPIDLIPYFVPVLGFVDDLLIVPLGIALALRLIPHDIIGNLRLRADGLSQRPVLKAGLALVAAIWLVAERYCCG